MKILIVVALSSCAQSGPDSYEACITDSMQGMNSDVGARAVISACRRQFPAEPTPVVLAELLPEEAFSMLEARVTHMGTRGEMLGTVYNGNPDWVVDEMTIAVMTPTGVSGSDSASRSYRTEVRVEPLSSAPFLVKLLSEPPAGWSWSVVAAKGSPVR